MDTRHFDAPIRAFTGSQRALAAPAPVLAARWRDAYTKEYIVHVSPFQLLRPLRHVRPRLRRDAVSKFIPVLMAMSLTLSVATPAFAGQPGHGHRRERHEQQHHREGGAKGKHRGKRKSVTRTFLNGAAIAIPAEDTPGEFGPADPYPSPLRVTGLKRGRITDLNLTLHGLGHTFTADIDILLVAPDGRNAVVMSDAVGGEIPVSDITLTLDDEAAEPLPSKAELTSGSFQPFDGDGPGIGGEDLTAFPAPAPTPSGKNALSTFDGDNPNGQWKLFVIDDTDADVGSVAHGWSLEITATVRGKAKKRKH